jgi:glycosyltransferase involved in cell wall biosynthesis
VRLETAGNEACPLVPVNAYLTGRVHFFFYGPELRALLADRWDLVHGWEEPYILAGAQLAWWTPPSTPLVLFSAQNLSKKYPPPFNWVERYAMAHASGWICTGQLVEENLRARPGYGSLPMAQIPMGTDLALFRPDAAARRATRESLHWEVDGPPVVGYLGRFVPEKGLDLLQRALDGVSAPWRALFVGAGPSEPSLRAWASRYGDRVRICNSVDHDRVPAYLNAMDVLCAPSQTTPRWREQFGRMLVEAFASGVAVIGSDSGEIPHVVKDSGLVVGEKDEQGWREAIEKLVEDRPRREELVARGLERASAEFAWPVVARRHLDFFDTVAVAPRGAA